MGKDADLAVNESVTEALRDIFDIIQKIDEARKKLSAIAELVKDNSAYKGAVISDLQQFMVLYENHLQNLRIYYNVACEKAINQIMEMNRRDQLDAKVVSYELEQKPAILKNDTWNIGSTRK